ncbi:SOS response-associated peptidase [Phormidium tenue FACHB-886]|nr:SOS response-associated peptidase [Phormidium tenue FACHB-886]
MCGRFTLTQSAEAIAEHFELEESPFLAPRYNIAPTQPVAVVRAAQNDRQFTHLHWGLIPSWSKDPTMGARLINARAETVAEKPSFRSALKYRRCLIPADGFYEWQRIKDKKQPYWFGLDDRQPFAFAGLWEHWQSPDGSEIESCTIITTAANALMQSIHDRMPVILEPQDYEQWLDPAVQKGDRLQSLLRPYSDEAMLTYPVSTTVNNPRNDSPDCIEPTDAIEPQPTAASPNSQ